MHFMVLSEHCNDKKRTVEILNQNMNLFRVFDHVFLFGSVLKDGKFPRDIDLLLVYSTYRYEISEEMNRITAILNRELLIPIDLLVLSSKELEETDLLKKIHIYIQLK